MRGRRSRGPAAVIMRLLAAVLFALSIAPSAWAGTWVIPPGQEALLSAMLGKGETLSGGCRWAGANVEASAIASRYDCDAGQVAITLSHVSLAGETALKTASFAIDGPRESAALRGAVAERVREREGAWRWQWVDDDHETTAPSADAAGVDARSEGDVKQATGPSEAPPSGMVPSIAWVVVALWCAAFAVVAARNRAPSPREDRLDFAAFAALFAAALALRLAVPSGPLDFAEPERTQAVWSPGAPLKAMFESIPVWMRGVSRLGLSTRFVLEGTGPLFGALGVAMAYALARAAGLRRAASIVAGCVVLVWPAHVRYAATSGFSVPGATLWTAALAVALTRRLSVAWKTPLLTALVVLAVYTRPEMRLLVIALVPVLLAAGPPAKERALTAAAIALCLVPYALAYVGAGSAAAPASPQAGLFARWVLTDVSVGMPWWFAAAALGWLFGRAAWTTRASLALAAMALALSYALFASEENPLWGQWRLYVAIVPFVAVAAACLVERVAAQRAALFVAAATIVSGLLYRDVSARPIDLQVEYAFVRDTAQAIAVGRDDLIVLPTRSRDRGTVHAEAVALSAIAASLGSASWPSDGATQPPDDPDREGPRLWTERVLLQGAGDALAWDRVALYVGLNQPEETLRRVRARFDLLPIELIERRVAPATPAVSTLCSAGPTSLVGASLDDCAVSLGWFRLLPKAR